MVVMRARFLHNASKKRRALSVSLPSTPPPAARAEVSSPPFSSRPIPRPMAAESDNAPSTAEVRIDYLGAQPVLSIDLQLEQHELLAIELEANPDASQRKRWWPIMRLWLQTVEYVVREKHSFKRTLVVYNGACSASVHIFDRSTCSLEDDERLAVVETCCLPKNRTRDKPGLLYSPPKNMFIDDFVTSTLAPPFESTVLGGESNLLSVACFRTATLDMIYHDGLRNAVARQWNTRCMQSALNNEDVDSLILWQDFKLCAQTNVGPAVRASIVRDIILAWCWPRVDRAASAAARLATPPLFSMHLETRCLRIPINLSYEAHPDSDDEQVFKRAVRLATKLAARLESEPVQEACVSLCGVKFDEPDEPDEPDAPDGAGMLASATPARDWRKNPNDVPIDFGEGGDWRTSAEKYIDEFIRYYRLAKYNGSRSIPIRSLPPPKPKTPFDRHKEVDYDLECERIIAGMRNDRWWWAHKIWSSGVRMNILLDDLYAIDLDGPDAVELFETVLRPAFPKEFEDCPLQETTKGTHYIFVRPTNCTHFYKSPGYQLLDGTKLKMDCITVTGGFNSKGQLTRGNLNVYPSKGKRWIRSIHDYPPRVMSDGLYALLNRHYFHTGVKRLRTPQVSHSKPSLHSSSSSGSAPPKEVDPRAQAWTRFIAKEAGCSESCIRWETGGLTVQGRVVSSNRKCLADSAHVAEHDNALLSIMENGSLCYNCMSRRCRKRVVFPVSRLGEA